MITSLRRGGSQPGGDARQAEPEDSQQSIPAIAFAAIAETAQRLDVGDQIRSAFCEGDDVVAL
jgi:hypothetical protein